MLRLSPTETTPPPSSCREAPGKCLWATKSPPPVWGLDLHAGPWGPPGNRGRSVWVLGVHTESRFHFNFSGARERLPADLSVKDVSLDPPKLSVSHWQDGDFNAGSPDKRTGALFLYPNTVCPFGAPCPVLCWLTCSPRRSPTAASGPEGADSTRRCAPVSGATGLAGDSGRVLAARGQKRKYGLSSWF